MKGTEPQPPHQGNRAHVNRLAPRKPAVDTGHSCSGPGLLCATGLRPGDPVPPPWRGSGHGGAQQRPYLSLWHGGEAQFPVGDEGVLHRVHRETVEGGLGAHVVLKAFDHSTIEPAPNGGPSASLAAVARCPAAWGTSFPRVPPRLSPASAGTIPLLWQQLRLLTGPTPTPDLKGRPVNWAPLALAARSSWVPLAGLSHRPPSSPSAHYNHRAARGASCLSPRPREIAPHPAPLPPPPGPGPRTGTRSHGHRCSDPGGSRSECLRYPPRHSGRSPEAVPWGQTAGRSRSCSEGPGWRRWLWARDKVGRYVGGCRGSSGTVSGT